MKIECTPIVSGSACGELLFSDTPLSFWGGIDPETGDVIDRHHPLAGTCVRHRVLAIPSGRGSCTGSGVMLQLLASGNAPAAIVFCEAEEIITLGAIVSQRFFGRSIPILRIDRAAFEALRQVERIEIVDGRIRALSGGTTHAEDTSPDAAVPARHMLSLSDEDRRMLAGGAGEAARLAMEVIVEMASVYGAGSLVNVRQAHIDGCIYTGQAGLAFAETLADLGARVRIPTTLNAISVDRRKWRGLGVDDAFAIASERLADAYLKMGAQPTYTCAPYLLGSRPKFGDQIVWAESNAVAFANSVLGARTIKYPDYLDICIAITGRAPLAGPHTDAGRRPALKLEIARMGPIDDSFFPLLGYHVGKLSGSDIPLLTGLEAVPISDDDMKAFSAAFATTASAPMFHIAGRTPEAASGDDFAALASRVVSAADLAESWRELGGTGPASVELIALGNPHFSTSEFRSLAAFCAGRRKHADVDLIVTTGRDVYEMAKAEGTIATVEEFGATILTDTCWCMIDRPVIARSCRTVGTNSAKYAHYGPGISGLAVKFGSLGDCVEAACTGHWPGRIAAWL